MEIPQHPSAYSALIALFFMFVGSLIQWIFLLRLRGSHGKLWNAMGRPTIWSDRSLSSAWETIQFIQKKRYVSLSYEKQTIEFCHRFRWPLVLFYWGTWISIVCTVACIIWLGWPREW